MDEHAPYITANLDLAESVEIGDFVEFFRAISSQFNRHMRANYPELASDTRFFVKEARNGSIIADLFPGGFNDIIVMMDSVAITIAFADAIGKAIIGYSRGTRKPDTTSAELKDFYGTVAALAKDTNGNVTVETATYERSFWKRKVAFSLTTNEARTAARNIEDHQNDIEMPGSADHPHVLMYFKRSDVGEVAVGKRSGERVAIESISRRDLPLIYASNLAEERIKHETRDADENVFHKGFFVDVNLQTKGGRPVAYAVTHVHQVIDLPRDD